MVSWLVQWAQSEPVGLGLYRGVVIQWPYSEQSGLSTKSPSVVSLSGKDEITQWALLWTRGVL